MSRKLYQVRPYARANGTFSFACFDGVKWCQVETKHGLMFRVWEANAFGRSVFDNYEPHEFHGRVEALSAAPGEAGE